jgi:hypothetical protein
MSRYTRFMRLIACIVVALALPLAVLAFQNGPMPGLTGGFGEPTCQQCHTGNLLNEPGGSVRLTLPAGFRPGSKYRITVSLARTGLKVGGFELASRFADGANAGRQAGELRAIDQRAQVIPGTGGGVVYAQHTAAGTKAQTAGALRWTLEWTAPRDGGNVVTFHVAANASNADASLLGDRIYTARASTRRVTGK